MNTFKSTTSKSLITQTPNKRSETSPVTNYDCLQRFQFTDAGETREQRLSSNQFTRRVRNLESIYTKKERASVNKCERRADQKAKGSIRNEPGSKRSRNSKKRRESGSESEIQRQRQSAPHRIPETEREAEAEKTAARPPMSGKEEAASPTTDSSLSLSLALSLVAF